MKTTQKLGIGLLTILAASAVMTSSASAQGFGMGGFKGHGFMDPELKKEMREDMQKRHEYLKSLSPQARATELEKQWQEREKMHEDHQKSMQDFLGLTPDQVHARREKGETFEQILKSQGKTADQTQSFLESQGNKRVDNAASKLQLPAERVQSLRAKVTEWANKMVTKWFGN